MNFIFFEITEAKRKSARLVRRTNGQVARKVPVKEGEKILYYLYR